jgi:putative transposase
MANYRRNFLPGGSYFFTVNLADRQRALLTDHIDLLRAAFR